ncbi:MAG: putative glucose-6-phosphate 1-epimerase [Spirochaetes bacterium ADurb.Bin110]|nr:MAG: putative glucose-6-phosphate 1-epimerase [Spirochaetes bacterium ADurb.Bin110]
MRDIQDYQNYALPRTIEVIQGKGGLPLLHIRNRYAECSLYLYGAHIASFKPKDHKELLWLSPYSRFSEGTPIRGGIPICFPWFSKHRTMDNLPLHGFVRTRFWNLESAEDLGDGRTKIVLNTESQEPLPDSWPYHFGLKIIIIVGEKLEMALIIQNRENLPIVCEDGFHTYFKVENPQKCQVKGLDGLEYIDRTKGDVREKQNGPAYFEGEIVHAFMHAPQRLELVDLAAYRKICIEQENMDSVVLWNPGEDASAANLEILSTWNQFICIESTNCLDCQLNIPPLGSHYSILRLSSISFDAEEEYEKEQGRLREEALDEPEDKDRSSKTRKVLY